MKRLMIQRVAIAGLMLSLLGCGSEIGEDDDVFCTKNVPGDYYTANLDIGGLTENGPSLMHYRVSFDGSYMRFYETDTVESLAYSCYGGVITSDAVEVDFDGAYKSVSITRRGVTTEYIQGDSEPDYSSCAEVQGRTYSLSANSVTDSADRLIAPAYPITSITFGDAQQLNYTDTAGEQKEAIFECTADQMHIHLSEDDEDPITVVVNRHGISITLETQLIDYELDEEVSPTVCPANYEPVCAVEPINVQCLVAPCPVGIYRTASNTCVAESQGWAIDSEGECGELEGQHLYDDPMACTKEYRPVCAAVVSTEPCGSVPCPSREHKTFGNQCEADSAKAFVLSDAECGKLEGTPVEGPLPGACTLQYDPVCGKVDKNIVCVTAPCPSHAYETFGNQCGAQMALANTVFEGECGDLEGLVTDGEPPVVIDENFPAVQKSVSVTEASIVDDVLIVTLGYSGCQEQHFELYFSPAFLESNPVQASSLFKPLVEDACEAYFTTQFRYDLLPLKHAWQQAYQAKTGEIILREIGIRYSF